MIRFLPLLVLLAACAVDRPGVAAQAPSPAPTIPTPVSPPEPPPPTLKVPAVPDTVPVPTPPTKPPADGSLLLSAGEQAEVGEQATLRYDKMLNDSRCPEGVQCVWAGEVRLGLTLTVAAKVETFELASARDSNRQVQGYTIELLEYGPCPLGRGAPKQECASLKVTAPEPGTKISLR